MIIVYVLGAIVYLFVGAVIDIKFCDKSGIAMILWPIVALWAAITGFYILIEKMLGENK